MKKALYFMPDISGFTNFVNSTELNHGIHIIAELLETLLDNNILNLKLVEIEGDALFMFTSKIPSYNDLKSQIETMFEAFHSQTNNFENQRICNCGSCKTTVKLGIKFLVHYGNLNFIKVKNIKKPYGTDVIKIHQLLKNKIKGNDYFLFTESVLDFYKDEIKDSLQVETSQVDKQDVSYFYKNLEPLKKNTTIQKTMSQEELDLSKPVITINQVFDANLYNIFNYLTDLKYRHIWDKEVKKIEFDTQKINRIGMKHNCVLNLGNLRFETIAKPTEDLLKYGEQTKNMIFTNSFTYIITLYKIDKNATNVKLEIFIKFTPFGKFIEKTILKIITTKWSKKLDQLNLLSKIELR